MAVIGKNILDNLTTGMYSDSKVIYREYIQNACDQIDLAIREHLISEDDGVIDIDIDVNNRYISIKDNATGVSKDNFVASLGNIADSDKNIKQNKGFRGIGRLCGLAYCKTLVFKTSFMGEECMSVMTCDAEKMRRMLQEDKKYTLDNVWDAIVTFSVEPAGKNEHFFEVELKEVNREDNELLNESKVREYLSFVAPVEYKNHFFMRQLIYEHAEKINFNIDEYRIRINGASVYKEYSINLKEQSNNCKKNYDEITSLEFKDFYDPDTHNLIAWMWYGLSRFEKQIPKCNTMRGLRVRCGNIQIGDEEVLKNLFKEQRGNFYYVGEVFVVDKKLIPNSQRDYFNQNETRVVFENLLREFFYGELNGLYYNANRLKNAYKKQADYVKKVEEFNENNSNGLFINKDEREQRKIEVEKAKIDAEKAQKDIEKFTNKFDEDSPIMKVKKEIERKIDSKDLEEKTQNTHIVKVYNDKIYATSSMNLSRKERKLVSRVLSIITDNAPKDVADTIIAKIREEFR